MASVKSQAEIDAMAEGGAILAEITGQLAERVTPGAIPKELDAYARSLMRKAGGKPAFLNYKPYGAERPFPASICVSLNDTVVHGVPALTPLKNGDLVKLDLGLVYKNLYTDTAITVFIGEIPVRAMKLMESTRQALAAGIAECVPGATLGDVGFAVHRVIADAGFHIVKDLTGHGIGHKLHEEPNVLNYGKRGAGTTLVPGMALAIEVMTGLTSGDILQRPDDSYATADGSLSAHFEHTIAITQSTPRILTASLSQKI